jgi:Tol biopolymer transport system component
VAYSNPGGLYLQRIDTGETYTVSTPDPRFKPAALGWFPDGSRLLAGGFTAQATDWSLWMIPVLGGSKQVKMGDYRGGLTAIGGAVSPDGSRIAFKSAIGGAPGIWIQGPEGGEPRRIVAFGPADALGSLKWTDRNHIELVQLAGDGEGNSGILSCDVRNDRCDTVVSAADHTSDSLRLPDGRIVFSR